MALRLPSLPALRVFEAAARHLSFTKAALELNVTQAAVSHQVRALEEQLGVSLFRRTTRRLALTREGLRLQPAATEAFEILRRAVSDIGRGEQVLAITTTPSFGARWLAPRMGRFAERHPGIELSIRHTQTVLDLGREGLDLAVRWGKGRWPGVESELIGPATRIVVGAPDYVRGLALKKPADIARATLLHEDTREGSGAELADPDAVVPRLAGQVLPPVAPGMVGLELVAQVPRVVVVDEDERRPGGQRVVRGEDRGVLVGLAERSYVELRLGLLVGHGPSYLSQCGLV